MKLYVIGLGPGDEELVTIKASKALMRCRTIFIPYSTGTNRSLAENIVKKSTPTNATSHLKLPLRYQKIYFQIKNYRLFGIA